MTFDALKDQLIRTLAPLESWRADAAPARSDFDLNPGVAPRSAAPLRQAAVLIPIIDRPEGPTVLLTQRADALSNHAGQIAFPGGRIDPGETAVQAALREAWEEVRLDPATVHPLGLSDTHETVTGFVVTPVVGWLAAPPVVEAQAAEVADVFEVPFAFLMDAANHRRDHFDPPDGPRRWFWAMPFGQRYIWGATAALIRALGQRLSAAAPAEDAA